MKEIRGFFGEYRFLSNFWEAEFVVDKIKYSTVEHYYNAMKAIDLDDHNYVADAPTPGLAKNRGRRISIRPDWDRVKLAKMRIGLRAKFEQNPDLKAALLATGDAELIEENTWGDTFWGRVQHKGFNHLGEMLMELRDSFKMERFYA